MPVTGMNKPLMNGLVLWLKMSEGVGTRLHDVSGYRNNGTISGATWVDGKFGKALSFNGANDYISILNSPSLNFNGAFTVGFWVKTTESDWRMAVSDWSGVDQQKFYIYGSPSIEFSVTSDGTAATRKTLSGNAVNNGVFRYVVAVFSPSTFMRIYIDGVLNVETTVNIPASCFISTNNLKIGELAGATRFNGILDEVRIYNRALNAFEVAKLYRERGYV